MGGNAHRGRAFIGGWEMEKLELLHARLIIVAGREEEEAETIISQFNIPIIYHTTAESKTCASDLTC